MHLRTAIVSLLAIALLGWFLRHADLHVVSEHVRNADVPLLLLGLALVAVTYWVRAVRWQYLLAPIGDTRFRTTFRTTVIGFAALSLLPARAGDVLRPYLLARQEGLSTSATFATVVMERVLDLVAVLALLGVFVWGFSDERTLPPRLLGPVQVSAYIAAAGAFVLLVVMWVLATHPERIGRVVFMLSRVLPHRVAERLAAIATSFSGGFAAARDPRPFVMAVIWSFPLWLAIAGEAWAVTLAFGMDMPFSGTFLLQALLVIGVAVPTPGGVGSYHEMYRFALTTFFQAPNDRAVAAAIVLHALSFVPVVLVGIVFMAQDGLTLGGLKAMAGSARDSGTDTSGRERPHTDEVPVLRPSGR